VLPLLGMGPGRALPGAGWEHSVVGSAERLILLNASAARLRAPIFVEDTVPGKLLLGATLAMTAALAVPPASAAPVYVALGDSITFGETDLNYVQSSGDRGYVGLFANTLAARNGGLRPAVFNLAIDGETASSFVTNAGRTPPVMGRGDSPLQLENLSYGNSNALSQSQLFANTVAAQRAAGNTVGTVTVTLGFNELAALAPMQNTP